MHLNPTLPRRCAPMIAFGAPLALLLVAARANGAIEGGPHDLIAQGYDVLKVSLLEERCTRCHIPSADLEGGPPEVPPVLSAFYGASSLVCFSCHDGTTIVSPDVDATRTAFYPTSHGGDLGVRGELGGEALGLPSLVGKRVECVTCHDPHNNLHRPFLRSNIQELCLGCHTSHVEFGRGRENNSGNHLLAVDPVVSPRAMAPITVTREFKVAFPTPYPIVGGKWSGGWHWDLGGHFSKGDGGELGCMTCHPVHGDETTPPQRLLLAVQPQNEIANRFCEGCHAGQRGDGKSSEALPNPGGTTTGRTYHPVDDDVANGEGRAEQVTIPSEWPLGTGEPPRLLCTTCHAAHKATAQTSILRPTQTGVGFCAGCHKDLPREYHHPLFSEATGDCAATLPVVDPETGYRSSCDFCHRAHNAGFGSGKEQEYLPLLREPLLGESQCLNCHPRDNPTCNSDPNFRASHFIGDPTLPETYAGSDKTLRRTPWSESGMVSPYGGEKGTVMLCISCHVFGPGYIVSGDKGTGRFLRARSGNPVEWEADEGVYLCTGCHAASLGTGEAQKGRTHPLLDALVQKLNREPQAPVTPTENGHINCDSCHRPHEAPTAGAYYILEVVEGSSTDPLVVHPTIDFTGLCRQCHEKF